MKVTAAGLAPLRNSPQPSTGLNSCSRLSSSSLKRLLPAGKLEKVADHDRHHEQQHRTPDFVASAGQPAPLRLPAHARGDRQGSVAARGDEPGWRQDGAQARSDPAPPGRGDDAEPRTPTPARHRPGPKHPTKPIRVPTAPPQLD